MKVGITLKQKIITEIFTEQDFKGLNSDQIDNILNAYKIGKRNLLENKSEHKEWRVSKRKLIAENKYIGDIIVPLISKRDTSSTMSIHIDEVFLSEVTLLSTEDIKMIAKIQGDIRTKVIGE